MLLMLLFWTFSAWISRLRPRPIRRQRRLDPAPYALRTRRKPAWVRDELIRIKALMRESGTCRAIAMTFNRRFAVRRRMTVGRTFVAEVIRRHRYEIEALRRALQAKTSWAIVRHLTQAIRRYGVPAALRTDNGAVFTSWAFRLALHVLGIRHQRTDPGCPWQNGRVERFFGTSKHALDRLAVDSFDALNAALLEFRFFFNHVRPHQHLDGRTPAEAWAGIDPYADGFRKEGWFEAWEGLLRGYYLRR